MDEKCIGSLLEILALKERHYSLSLDRLATTLFLQIYHELCQWIKDWFLVNNFFVIFLVFTPFKVRRIKFKVKSDIFSLFSFICNARKNKSN